MMAEQKGELEQEKTERPMTLITKNDHHRVCRRGVLEFDRLFGLFFPFQ